MLKILIVCSGNKGIVAPFIKEQADAISKLGHIIDYYQINGKGIIGYLMNLKSLIRKIKQFNPDLIHAHYGFSGLLSNFQRKIPVITTYHGSDINLLKAFLFSIFSIRFSKFNIFVSQKNALKGRQKNNYLVIPCGVDNSLFNPLEKIEARTQLNISITDHVILFAGAFHDKVKNYPLAYSAISTLHNVKLIELKGYSRKNVSILINACDVLLLTSFTEGSPQIIKEAMACNCPIVSTDVGDVSEVIGETKGCYLCSYNSSDIAEKILMAMEFAQIKGRTNGRKRIIDLGLTNENIAKRIVEVYENVLKMCK